MLTFQAFTALRDKLLACPLWVTFPPLSSLSGVKSWLG